MFCEMCFQKRKPYGRRIYAQFTARVGMWIAMIDLFPIAMFVLGLFALVWPALALMWSAVQRS
jgi:hypothetical protein